MVVLLWGFSLPMAKAQIPAGGWPRLPAASLSEWLPQVSMPRVSNTELQWRAEAKWLENTDKNFEFAHTFEVDFTPWNQGVWHQSSDGWYIWRLRIHSKDAYSINLILEQYQPGSGDRIFLYSPSMGHIQGAFTSRHIYHGQVLAISPIPGDEVIVHYETRNRNPRQTPFIITRINHDFFDLLKMGTDRRPLGTIAGSCIADINCAEANRWRDLQNSVVRVMVAGRELCTGTLLNNTADDGKPYVLTAGHCIGSDNLARSSLFHFNYESPYCGSLDGDISQSISGSTLRAYSDSLDFSLVELNEVPPPAFRPYYAGWNRAVQIPDTVAAIHHSQGDIKKISIANGRPVVSGFGTSSLYTPNGFWRISNWTSGATERGASGSPLLDRNGLLIGSLTGGSSSCANPINDYFSRFNQAWAFQTIASGNLKTWLDPANLNPQAISGRPLYEGIDYCKTFTNLKPGDVHQVVGVPRDLGTGFYSGNNSLGITHVAEKFKLPAKARLSSVSLGVAQIIMKSGSPNSSLEIEVFEFRHNQPTLLHQQTVALNQLAPHAMNLIEFDKIIEPADSFMVSVGFSRLAASDTLVLYQTLRSANSDNTLLLKRNGAYLPFSKVHEGNLSASLVAELVACNLTYQSTDSLLLEVTEGIVVFPNPSSNASKVMVRTEGTIAAAEVVLYNLNAQRARLAVEHIYSNQIQLDLSGNPPGLYILRVQVGDRYQSAKIVYHGN